MIVTAGTNYIGSHLLAANGNVWYLSGAIA